MEGVVEQHEDDQPTVASARPSVGCSPTTTTTTTNAATTSTTTESSSPSSSPTKAPVVVRTKATSADEDLEGEDNGVDDVDRDEDDDDDDDYGANSRRRAGTRQQQQQEEEEEKQQQQQHQLEQPKKRKQPSRSVQGPRDSCRIELLGMVEEMHKQPIYCVTWCKDMVEVVSDSSNSSSSMSSSRDKWQQLGGKKLSSSPSRTVRQKWARMLATCAGRYVTVYTAPVPGGGGSDDEPTVHNSSANNPSSSQAFTLQLSFCDENVDEVFYVCAFAGRSPSQLYAGFCHDPDPDPKPESMERDNAKRRQLSHSKKPSADPTFRLKRVLELQADTKGFRLPQLLCAGGRGHHVKVFDLARQRLLMTLVGHGNEVLDLKTCPVDEMILASASRDRSVRLWNVRTGANIAILGCASHMKDSIVSISWHASGHFLANSGFDRSINIWDTAPESSVGRAIALSHKVAQEMKAAEQRVARAIVDQFPIFWTRQVHFQVVDCVQFLGDAILSKSTDGVVELWLPIKEANCGVAPQGNIDHLKSFSFPGGDLWWLRFATDPSNNLLAVGNVKGKVYVWEMKSRSNKPILILNPGTDAVIRTVEFSPCGRTLVASTDKGTIYMWDVDVAQTR